MSDNLSRPSAPTDKAADSQSAEPTGDHGGSGRTNPVPARPPAADATEPLPQFGQYRVVRKIGEGGMGSVFLAEDTRLNRKTAIKTMRPEVAAAPANRERFEREAKAAAAVEHDNIVPILHIGEASDGTPFIVMPFLQGEMLDSRLKRERASAPELILKVAAEVAEGLAAAHARGLIHRDIKPGNVWLEGDPSAATPARRVRRVKILDFGLARSVEKEDVHITASGAILGTPAYMAPEQARGERVDHRADLWSLGVMLYRMATGQQPFRGPNTMAVLIALATEHPLPVGRINPSLPPALAGLIEGLMQKNPDARPQTAAEVAQAVRQIAQGVPPPSGSYHATPAVVPVPIPLPVPVPMPAANPWEEATAADEDEDADEATVARAPAEAPARSRLPWLVGGLVAGLLALVVFAAVVIRFQTAEGTLVVELADKETGVQFQKGQLILFGPDGKEMYRLSPGERDKKLPAGPYTVKVEGPGGLKLSTTAFTLTRGDRVTVRVTFVPPKDEGAKPGVTPVIPAATVADFREVHGATEQELEDWMRAIQKDGYIPEYLSTEGVAAVRFSAVAVPNPDKLAWKFVPRQEPLTARWQKDLDANLDAGFRPLACADHFADGRVSEAQVWVSDRRIGGSWFGGVGFISDKVKQRRDEGFRPLAVNAVSAGGVMQYQITEVQNDDARAWHVSLGLTLPDLAAEVAGNRNRWWRPEWISACRDGDKVRYAVLFRANPKKEEWAFQSGLTAAAYETELKTRRAAGVRPLSVAGYADGDQTKYVVVWGPSAA